MNLLKILANPGQDFRQYYDAIYMILHNLGNPYQFLTTSPGPFNYPPPVFLFLFPFGFFGLSTSWYIWVILALLSLFVSMFLLLKLSNKLTPLSYLVAPILLWFLFFPTKFTLGMGQINLFILLFITLTIYFYHRKNYSASAFFLALAAVIKLSPGLLALYFIYTKDFKTLVKFIFIVLSLLLLSLPLMTFNYQSVYYFDVFFRAFGLAGKDIYYNQSLIAFLSRSLASQTLIAYIYYAFILFSLWYIRKSSGLKLWGYLTCLVLLLNPLAWQHYFVLAIIPLILLPANPLAYLLLAWNWPVPGSVPRELWPHQFFGALLLLFNYKYFWVIIITIVYFFSLLCKGGYCF